MEKQNGCIGSNNNSNSNSNSNSKAPQEDKEEEEEEDIIEEQDEGEIRSLLSPTTVVNGETAGQKRQRKVRFNDCKLTQVLEFQPSDVSDSDDDSNEGFSLWDDVVVVCAQICTWLSGRRLPR